MKQNRTGFSYKPHDTEAIAAIETLKHQAKLEYNSFSEQVTKAIKELAKSINDKSRED